MEHYGLKHKNTGAWLRDTTGVIFWTTSMVVAEAQRQITCVPGELEVCPFNVPKVTEQVQQ